MGEEPARLRADVARTRDELGATLNELGRQLDPRMRAGRAVGGARADVSDRLAGAVTAAREDPRKPAALALLALALLIRRRRR